MLVNTFVLWSKLDTLPLQFTFLKIWYSIFSASILPGKVSNRSNLSIVELGGLHHVEMINGLELSYA